MPHMVIFRTNEGKQAYHPTDALEDAIRFVEHLRNAEQVTDVHVFRMQEVPLEFKVLYKVEVSGGDGETAAAAAPAAPTPPARGAQRTPPAQPSDEATPAASAPARGEGNGRNAANPPDEQLADQQGGRFGLFSRSS